MSNTSNGTSANRSRLAAYADLFDRLLDCVLLADPATFVILEANPACERVFGVPADKLIGRSVSNWVEKSVQDDFNKALRISVRRYHPRQFDSVWEFEGGRKLVFEVSTCPLKLSDGTEVLQIICHDMTAKREAEQKVQTLLRELQVANVKLEALSIKDEMTGIYNYRHFMKQLTAEHSRSLRTKAPYSLIFCDLDNFKKFNDTYGHMAGDQALKSFGDILIKASRSMDIPSRYGGEEFAIICPETGWEGAMVLADRIRRSTEKQTFEIAPGKPSGNITCSVGVSSYPTDGDNAEQILKAADDAAYHSKSHGKNQVTAAHDLKSKSGEVA
jgi:diguanylate cyclase (GGDEF)-like protein/PAS domain S-box-containing protein